MSTATVKKLLQNFLPHDNVPYGNKLTVLASLATTAAGVAQNTDLATALQVGDKVRFGVIPGGTRLQDAIAIVSDAFTATSTANIGFEYVDGVDDANVPQDDDYFFAGLNLAATGRTRQSTAVRPVTLPKDAYLVMTNAGAAQAAAGQLDVIVEGAIVGRP